MDEVEVLLERIRARSVGASEAINPFWRRLLTPLEPMLHSGTDLSPQLLNKVLGYGARRLPKQVASNRDLPEWPALMRAAETGVVTGLGKTVEHVAILRFLQQKEVIEDYVASVDRFRLVSNLAVARLYWYSVRLGGALTELRGRTKGDFLEIGAGSGFFGILMADQGWARHYVVVDLPEMLLNAVVHVRAYLPDVQIRLGETPDFSYAKPTFWFLDTDEIRKIPDASTAVALNFNSFMEMDEGVRDFYIQEIYRTARPGALFYNVNRRQNGMTRLDGRLFDNNPLLYPYRPTDRIIEWETDECQETCRSAQFKSSFPSFSISRMAELSG